MVSQCYFATAESNSSVSLAVTQSDPSSPGKQTIAAYWEQTFGRFKDGDKEGEAGAKKSDKDGGEEKEKEQAPERIDGLGEEAFWAGNRFGGALYVLQKDVMLRISVGGTGDAGAKLERSKALAKKALTRL